MEGGREEERKEKKKKRESERERKNKFHKQRIDNHCAVFIYFFNLDLSTPQPVYVVTPLLFHLRPFFSLIIFPFSELYPLIFL